MGSFNISEHDTRITNHVKFIIRADVPFADPATVVKLDGYLGKPFPFQFPPVISGDGKGASWNEENKISYEPIALWEGASPRKLTVTANYAVVNEIWNGRRIAKIAHAAKAYFYRSVTSVFKDKKYGPIVEISNMYGAIQEKSTWRLTEVGVEYSPELINQSPLKYVRDKMEADQKEADARRAREINGIMAVNGPLAVVAVSNYLSNEEELKKRANEADPSNEKGVTTNEYYPLTTKITFSCVSYTQIADGGVDAKPLQPVDALKIYPTTAWY